MAITQDKAIKSSPVTGVTFLDRSLFALAVLALALSPTQLTLPGLPLSAAELTLALAALVWAIRWLKERDSNNLPPFAVWLFVAAALLSLTGIVNGYTIMDSDPAAKAVFHGKLAVFLPEMAKLVLYLIIGVTVFRAVLNTPARIKIAIAALLATTSLAVLLALIQRFILPGMYQPVANERVVFEQFNWLAYVHIDFPTKVSSTFGSWNQHGYHASSAAYAGYLGLVLPFALAFLVELRKRRGVVLWISLFFLSAALSMLSGYIMPAIIFGLIVTGVALGAHIGRWVLVGIIGYLLLCMVMPFNRQAILQDPFQLKISRIEADNRYGKDGPRHLKKFWGEQYAAMKSLRGSMEVNYPALFGYGVGQYQPNLPGGFNGIADVAMQRLESDTQSGYLFIALTLGFFGLAALFALYSEALRGAWRALRAQPRNPWTSAALGAMVMLMLLTLVSPPLLRGTLMVVAALLALCANGEMLARKNDHEI